MTWTVLHHACEHLDSKCIFERCKTSTNELLEVDDHGSTPLHILAWGNPDIHLLQALVDCCPAALPDKNVHGDTCLHIASSFPATDVKVVKLLLDACPGLVSIKNKEGLMPLHVACRFAPKNEAIIGLLIDKYPSALLKPIKMGDLVPRRQKKAGHPDHFVAPDNRTNFSEGRFQSASNQIRDGAYPLHMAVKSGASISVLTMMVQAAKEVLLKTNKFGETPLHVALRAEVHDDAVIKLLIDDAGQALHMKDFLKGNFPAHVAATHGCSVCVAKILFHHNPSALQEKNKDGMTPLDLALVTGKCSEEVLGLLQEESGDVEAEAS